MVYLVAKIIVLLLFAAMCGFLMARWWLGRRYRDVTDEYQRLVSASSQRSLAAEELLGSIDERLRAIDSALRDVRPPELGPMEAGLREVLLRLAALESPAVDRETDLAPLSTRIDGLQRQVEALRPLLERSAAEEGLQGIEERLAAALDGSLQGIRLAELGPIEDSLRRMLDRLAELESIAGDQESPDLSSLSMRMDALQQQVEGLRSLLERSAAPEATSISRPAERNLLRQSPRGKRDDLKRIRGIGVVLERLLHRLGIYYFWQIAAWNHDDVSWIEEHLDVFKERISRDHWVAQAKKLASEPGAAQSSIMLATG